MHVVKPLRQNVDPLSPLGKIVARLTTNASARGDGATRCHICQTPFSLAVRRHHCRLCGNLVCSSPRLPQVLLHDEEMHAKQLELWEPCSSLMLYDASSKTLRDIPNRPDTPATSTEWRDYEVAEKDGIRFCRSCKSIVHRIMLRNRRSDDMPLCPLYQVCIS